MATIINKQREREFKFGPWMIKVRPSTDEVSGRITFTRPDGSEVYVFDSCEDLYHSHKKRTHTDVIRYERMAG
jgi:hypothetical protein